MKAVPPAAGPQRLRTNSSDPQQNLATLGPPVGVVPGGQAVCPASLACKGQKILELAPLRPRGSQRGQPRSRCQ